LYFEMVPRMARARWHRHHDENRPNYKKHRHDIVLESKRRNNAGNSGLHLIRAPIVRQRLYEWFLSVRYSIDWKTYNSKLRSRGAMKAIGRFPRSLLRVKLKQFLAEYAEECLTRGVRCKLFQPTSRWFRSWEAGFGLAIKRPNRKYKCSKELLGQRLRAFWITVFRIRALCLAVCGYDPEMENFDQTPYHANESGSQDACTLGVVGCTVPLIEGHGDTRVRWTANLTTFSNAQERMGSGEMPYCEFMFKHNIKGEQSQLELRLREHIRGRGYGSWVSVATSASGSYTADDILNFLETHLPVNPQLRANKWRIMFADDFAAHKTDAVRRLCWERGYVLIVHPGGATPFTQTCDTDLNQHVRRDYIALETVELIRHFQQGEVVPKLTPETMIDLMVEVLSVQSVHTRAARGYKKTAVAVSLDGEHDEQIEREAKEFWDELGMRRIVDAEIARVRSAVVAGHLAWSYDDVQGLTMPYKKSKKYDAAIEHAEAAGYNAMAEEAWVAAGGDAHEDSDTSDGSSSSEEASDANEDMVEESSPQPAVAGSSSQPADANSCSPQSRAAAPSLSAEEACAVHGTQDRVNVLQAVMQELQASGALRAAQGIQHELTKERRRARALCQENPVIALALHDRAEREEARLREVRREAADTHKTALTAKRLKLEISEAKKVLQDKKEAVKDLECVLETKHALKTFTPELLGDGQPRSGGAKAQKARFDVLDRLARLGVGLSAAQKNDWAWFKSAWDARMIIEQGENWPRTFATWIQQVLDDMTHVAGSNAFSEFVHSETLRSFSDQPALIIPVR
jgi:hypothetical protein